jgi:hypothetical protein
MEKKILIGTILGAIAGTIITSIWFMGIFGSQAEKWMTENAACVKQMNEMPMWAWILATLLMGFLGALTLHKLGIHDVKKGALTGLYLFALVSAIIGLFFYVTLKNYELSWLPIDILGNSLGGLAGGAAIGWWYGRAKPA